MLDDSHDLHRKRHLLHPEIYPNTLLAFTAVDSYIMGCALWFGGKGIYGALTVTRRDPRKDDIPPPINLDIPHPVLAPLPQHKRNLLPRTLARDGQAEVRGERLDTEKARQPVVVDRDVALRHGRVVGHA